MFKNPFAFLLRKKDTSIKEATFPTFCFSKKEIRNAGASFLKEVMKEANENWNTEQPPFIGQISNFTLTGQKQQEANKRWHDFKRAFDDIERVKGNLPPYSAEDIRSCELASDGIAMTVANRRWEEAKRTKGAPMFKVQA